MRSDANTPEKFWAGLNRTESGCWFWTGTLNHGGYGTLTYRGGRWRAHRLAYFLTFGPITDGLCVLHRCDQFYAPKDFTYRACCRPDHLWLGTRADNNRDMFAKGRADLTTRVRGDKVWSRAHPELVKRGDQHHSRLHPECMPRGDRHGARLHPERLKRGSDNWRAVLTEDAVRELRRLRADEHLTYAELGARFGVHLGTAWRIVKGQGWSHIR